MCLLLDFSTLLYEQEEEEEADLRERERERERGGEREGLAMAVSVRKPASHLWDAVLEITKSAQDKNSDPLLWAIQLSSNLNSAGVSLPSVELAHLLVSHICWANHVPITWKFLEKALTVKIAPPMLVLALLSTR